MLSKRLPIDFINNKEFTYNSQSSLEDEPEKTSRDLQLQGEEKKNKKKNHSQLLVNISGIEFAIQIRGIR
jgi:hypothetical protein